MSIVKNAWQDFSAWAFGRHRDWQKEHAGDIAQQSANKIGVAAHKDTIAVAGEEAAEKNLERQLADARSRQATAIQNGALAQKRGDKAALEEATAEVAAAGQLIKDLSGQLATAQQQLAADRKELRQAQTGAAVAANQAQMVDAGSKVVGAQKDVQATTSASDPNSAQNQLNQAAQDVQGERDQVNAQRELEPGAATRNMEQDAAMDEATRLINEAAAGGAPAAPASPAEPPAPAPAATGAGAAEEWHIHGQ